MKTHRKRISVTKRKSKLPWIAKGWRNHLNNNQIITIEKRVSDFQKDIERTLGRFKLMYSKEYKNWLGIKENIPILIRLRNALKYNEFISEDLKRHLDAHALKVICTCGKRKSIRKTAREAYLLLTI